MSENLRNLTVAIGFDVPKSPLSDLNREMNRFTKNATIAGGSMKQMGSSFSSANSGMIKESQSFNKEVNRQTDFIRQLASTSGVSATKLAASWSDMSTEMQKSMIRNHNEMRKYRKDLMGIEHDMHKLGMQMGHYKGTNDEFMKSIYKMGKDHKKITDNMINNNMSMRQGMIQTVATMSAMSGQSEKISANYDRMDKAIYKVNKPILAVTSNLERMARNGNATQLALKMLGPNASMKALQDQTRLITQGVMRQQSVVMAAGIAWLGFTAILANAAKGPSPSEIKAEQENLTNIYKEAWQNRVDEISHFVGLFEKVSVPKVKSSDVMKAMQSQMNAMNTWRSSLQSLTKKGVDKGLIKELQKAGPAAAYQIKAIDQMSKPALAKYVKTWQKTMGLARIQATDELTTLKQETDAKIKGLRDSITPLGSAWEKFKGTWATALKPFAELWGQLAAGFVMIGTKAGEFINKLNKINPWITKIGGLLIFLAITFTMVFSPLAVGIGLFGGMAASLAGLWAIIGPFVIGFASIAGTALLVSGALIAVGAAIYLLWTRSETFRNGVISGWNAIKSSAISVWGFIQPYIMQAIGGVVSFVQQILGQLTAFWNQNGAQILGLVKMYFMGIWSNIQLVMGLIKGLFQIVFPIIVGIVKIAWVVLKTTISNSLTLILGIIKVGLALLRGDWSGAWKAIKQTAITIMNNIINFFKGINLFNIGKSIINGLINGIGSMAGALSKRLNGIVSSINGIMSKIGIKVKIPSIPVPKYAKGIKKHPGGLAVLGDGGGPELYRTPKGHIGLSPATDTLMNLPRGTEVFPYRNTMKLLSNVNPAIKNGVKSIGSFSDNVLNSTGAFSNQGSNNTGNSDYNPSVIVPSTANRPTINFNPMINIDMSNTQNSGGIPDIKRVVKEELDDQWQRLISIYGIEVLR